MVETRSNSPSAALQGAVPTSSGEGVARQWCMGNGYWRLGDGFLKDKEHHDHND